MLKLLSSCKWYWFLPFIGVIFLHKISCWVFEHPTIEGRMNRDSFILITIIPIHCLCFYFLLIKII